VTALAALVTTIQKFQELTSVGAKDRRTERGAPPTLSEASNIFVMVDEAHRTQYRALAANLRQALPNACFLGFTGTPIDKKDKSTLRTFGPYIDTYTIEQAVRDGATVPIFYESRLPTLHIIGQSIDKVFDAVFADRTDEERATIKQRYATEEAIAGAPRRIEAICLNLLEHYRQFIAPNGFKAQVVAVSRDVAVTYKETLDRLNGPESALIMSGQHNDPERLARWHLSREQQDRLAEQFKDKGDRLALLVVCDMLLTGFDAPVEQVMYLDSPLREHNLLQAVARVNRTADKKDYGLVVDYWGISNDLKNALAIFSSTDIQGALEPKGDELPRLQSRHAAVLRFFHKVRDRNDLDACVRVLEPEDVRAEFDVAFRRFSQSMDMLLPDPRALSYTGDLRWLGKIRGTARARYHDDRLDLAGCGEKVRKIIADAVVADGIEILVKEVPLLSKEFEDKVEALTSDNAKASEMEHAIRHEIHVRLEENPAFYQLLRKRLEEIIQAQRQHRIESAKELLHRLETLRREIAAEQQTAQDMHLTPTGFAIYGLLEQSRPPEVAEPSAVYNEANRDLASLIHEAIEPITDLVDWWQKEDLQREMRKKIKRQLRASGIPSEQVEKLAAQIVDLAKVREAR
jgi:type I restriction enzyme R subunit